MNVILIKCHPNDTLNHLGNVKMDQTIFTDIKRNRGY